MAKKKNKNSAKVVAFIIFMLVVTIGGSYYITSLINKPKFVRYPGFGIDMPVNYSIHGIDVSRYQSLIDWKDVKGMRVKNIQVGFCFIKATEGIQTIDGRYRRNWFEARKAGLPRGAYHFFNAGKSGKAQAQNFMQAVQLMEGDLPPVLDVEQLGNTPVNLLQQRVGEWLTQIENRYGVKPIIYTNADFYKNNLAGKFDDYPLWVAHYLVKDKPRIKRDWTFWQHNEAGRVNGITSFVDFNVFNGDSAAFRELLIK